MGNRFGWRVYALVLPLAVAMIAMTGLVVFALTGADPGSIALGVLIASLAAAGVTVPIAMRLGATAVGAASDQRAVAAAIAGHAGIPTHTPHGPEDPGVSGRDYDRMALRVREKLQGTTTDHNLFHAIFGSMVEGVIAVDRNTRINFINPVGAAILGTTPDDASGRHVWEITRVLDIVNTLDATLRSGRISQTDVHLFARGSERYLTLHASPLRDADHALSGAVIMIHDTTELHRLESVRRDFVANVSHELKTPLTAIRGLVETVLDDREMPDAMQQRFLRKLHSQAQRLTVLVTDLLALSRVESRPESLERVVLDVRRVLATSAANLQPTATERNLSLSVDVPGVPLLIDGDSEALRQIVDNLLGNALAYTPESGRVWLRARAVANEVVIEVADTGIGIARDHVDRIFERFYRVDKARSREAGGTGLGLSIVKNFTTAIGGRVFLESTVGKGSTFTVAFPVATVCADSERMPGTLDGTKPDSGDLQHGSEAAEQAAPA